MGKERLPKKVINRIQQKNKTRERAKGQKKCRALNDETCNDRRYWQLGIGQRRGILRDKNILSPAVINKIGQHY